LENEGYRCGMRFVRHVGDERAFFEAKERSLYISCPKSGAD
jgi:hypothetical protein